MTKFSLYIHILPCCAIVLIAISWTKWFLSCLEKCKPTLSIVQVPYPLCCMLGKCWLLVLYQIVSNGKFQSVEHRVVTNQGDARLSIAMFRHASGDANIGPAPELVDALHPALYPTTNYTTYRASFHRKGHNGKVLPAQWNM